MARKVRERSLDTRAARDKLKVSGKPYYRSLGPELHLGYRKGASARRWVARLYLGGGNYKVIDLGHVDDVADADGATVLSFWQAQEKAQRLIGEKRVTSSRFTVGKAIEQYVLDGLDGKPTQRATQQRLAAYVPENMISLEVEALSTQRLESWLRDIARAPARWRPENQVRDTDLIRQRKASANRVLGMLRAALNFAYRHGHVDSDAAWRRVKPFKAVDSTVARSLTVAEAKRLINSVDTEFRPLVQAALLTGCRFSELTRLKAGDFNPDTGTLHIRQSKSGKARHVILTEEGAAFFTELAAGLPRNGVLLPTTVDQHRASGRIAEACGNARINPKIRFHDLRHTWASLAVMAGVPLMVVARNLGHVDTQMVQRHYGHLVQDYIVDALRAGAPRFGIASNPKIKIHRHG